MFKSLPSTVARFTLSLTLGLFAWNSALAAGEGASVKRVSLDAAPAEAQEIPATRADLMRTFKARCPGRVERLLSIALPSERPDFTAIADICGCAASAVQALPENTPAADYPAQAAQAALACSKGTITARNEQRARRAFSPYLTAQGLNAQQIGTFSRCAADTHWRNTTGGQAAGGTSAWWGLCSEQIGRKDLSPPEGARD